MQIPENMSTNINLYNLLNSLQDGIIIFNSNESVHYMNESAKELLKFRKLMQISNPKSEDYYFDLLIKEVLNCRINNSWKCFLFDNKTINIKFCEFHPDKYSLGFTAILSIPNKTQQEEGISYKSKGFVAKATFDDIICNSSSAKKVVELSKQYAVTNSNILIVGESGVGKEVFVQAIHRASSRRNGPFVAINCATLPENLLESELFGYVGGAFTGALKQGRKGYFELANKGTIFLDEIGEVSLITQARLLRVIQEKEITRIGDEKVINIDTRIISATNKDLSELVNKRLFREDLFYRIDVLRINVPPIRERKEDIPTLIDHLLLRVSPTTKIHPEAVNMLMNYPWPGNIRQLNNLCERAVAISDKIMIMPETIKYLLEMEDMNHQRRKSNYKQSTIEDKINALNLPINDISALNQTLKMRQEEREILIATMDSVQNNKTLAAKKLGISRTTLWRKLKDSGID